MKKIINFFKDTKAELKKVVWISRGELMTASCQVLGSMLVVGTAVGVFDWLVGVGITALFGLKV